MPFPIAAVIGAVVSKYMADQQAKAAAAQSATDAMNKPPPPAVNMQPVTLESLDLKDDPTLGGDEDPFAGEGFGDGGLPTGADQATPGASVINTNPNPVEGTALSARGRALEDAQRPVRPLAGPPITDEGLQPSGGEQTPQVPQTGAGDTSGKMTGLEMAQLGLTLGSMLGKRKPGPGIPSLPGNDYPGMKPVFRG